MAQKTDFKLPEWMNTKNDYVPEKDNHSFITKTILGFFKLFRHFHIEKNENISQTRAGTRLVLVFGIIFLCALTKNLFFCAFVAAGLILLLCFTKIEILKKVVATSFIAALFTFLIMLPSFIFLKSNAFINISIKVFLSTSCLILFALTTPWNKITASLSYIKIPSFVIFVVDLTIHYILILGNISYELLFALQLRSVGKNQNKEKSVSGIIGNVFLQSMNMAHETQEAMECRLFNGNYVSKKQKSKIMDFIPLVVLILYTGIYIVAI